MGGSKLSFLVWLSIYKPLMARYSFYFTYRIIKLLFMLLLTEPVLCHVVVDPAQIINGGQGLGGVTWFVAEPAVHSAQGCKFQVAFTRVLDQDPDPDLPGSGLFCLKYLDRAPNSDPIRIWLCIRIWILPFFTPNKESFFKMYSK